MFKVYTNHLTTKSPPKVRGFYAGQTTQSSWHQNTLPHNPHHPITSNILSFQHTTESLQWFDLPLWDIVVHEFSFLFFWPLPTTILHLWGLIGTTSKISYCGLWHNITEYGGITRILFLFVTSNGATLILLFAPPFSLAKGVLTIIICRWQTWGMRYSLSCISTNLVIEPNTQRPLIKITIYVQSVSKLLLYTATGMIPLWSSTCTSAAKDPSSFMGGPSLPCLLQVTSSAHQPPFKFEVFHHHH